MAFTDKLIEFGTAYLLKEVQEGTETSFWKKISGSKLAGLLMVFFGIFGFSIDKLNFEQASATITAGIGMIRLRIGQTQEANRTIAEVKAVVAEHTTVVQEAVTEHLDTQDDKIQKLDALLEKVAAK